MTKKHAKLPSMHGFNYIAPDEMLLPSKNIAILISPQKSNENQQCFHGELRTRDVSKVYKCPLLFVHMATTPECINFNNYFANAKSDLLYI